MMKHFLLSFTFLCALSASSQCSNFTVDNFDSFEYSTVCPFIIPNTTYQNSPQQSPGFGPNFTGNYHIYLNFADGYVGPAFSRPYPVCVGGTYRISFYHRDAWGGQNNTTFNVYDANDVLLSTQVVPWTGTTWNQWMSPELTATTTTLRLEIVNNSFTIGNNDMVVDDMSLAVCTVNENRTLLTCNAPTITNLFSLFSANMPTTGTWSGPSTLSNGYLGTYDPASGVEGIYTYAINGTPGCPTPTGTVTIAGGVPIDLGPDIHSCIAQPVALNAGPNYDFYSWSTGATTQSINVSAPGTYSVEAGRLGGNLIQNPDFQGGTTAASNTFTSSYVPGTGGAWGLLSNPGQFAISTNPSLTHNNFLSCGDHTTGTGNMFVANGASGANTTVWSQTVNVDPNQEYLFSFWAMNVGPDPNLSSLQLFVNGVAIGSPNNTAVTPCNWTQINDSWNSGGATQAVLSIVNQSTSPGGNDFALDDIYFAPYCSFYDTVVVTVANHNLTLNNNHTICEGASSTLVANATSTTAGNFVYQWNNIPDDVASQTVSPIGTTTYTVFATGDDGCNTPTRTVTIGIAPQPNPNAGVDDIICIGDVISLVGTIGSTSNTRTWSHNVNGIVPVPTVTYAPNATNLTPTVTVNQPGIYSFILTEQNNACGIFRDTVEVLVSTTSHQTAVIDLTCFGNGTGEIEIVNPDGVNYSFDNEITWTTTNVITGLDAGNYTVWSENQHGCRFSSDVTVNEPAPLSLITSNDTLVCENGTANLVANASVVGANYHWNFTTDFSNAQSVSPIADSIVEVYAEDANGCLSAVEQITISVRAPLSGLISPDTFICPGYPTTIGVNTISGGLPTYTIVWSSGEMGQGTAMNISANPPVTQTYTVTITDACESTPLVLTTEVEVALLPIPLISSPDPSICEPASFELTNMTDPTMVQSVSWIISDGQFFMDQETISTALMPAGSYDVQMIVTSPQGCIDSLTITDYLVVYPLPVANFNWSPNPVTMFNTIVNFTNNSSLAVEYEWTFEDGDVASSFLKNPQVKFPDGVVGTYEVTLIAITEHGCRDTISRIIEVHPEVILYAPNTFTPDGDEFNQTWRIHADGLDIYSFNIQIYNRWGEMVFESNDPFIGWDGTYKGRIVETGTYSWRISARDRLSDNKYEWNGNVNVLR